MPDSISPLQRNYSLPNDFVTLAKRHQPDAIFVMLGYIWQGYDQLRQQDRFKVSNVDNHLEDEITDALHARIQDVMRQSDPYSPFAVVHQPLEGGLQKPGGRPPESDLGFRLRGGNVRSHFSVEAKVIRTDGAVSAYVKEVNENFLTYRYSTFSSQAAMLGYLLSGTDDKAFKAISAALGCKLRNCPAFPNREHRCSSHQRNPKAGSNMTNKFTCHHLILIFD